MPNTKSIAELSRALAAQQKRVAKLQSQRAKFLSDLQAIDKQIAALTGRAGVKGPARPATGARRSRAKKALPACLIEALAKAKGTKMRAMHLADAVVEAGYVTRDRNFKNTVAKTLAKDKRFKRVGRGMYKLAAAANL